MSIHNAYSLALIKITVSYDVMFEFFSADLGSGLAGGGAGSLITYLLVKQNSTQIEDLKLKLDTHLDKIYEEISNIHEEFKEIYKGG